MRALRRLIRWGFACILISFIAVLATTLLSRPCTEITEQGFAYGIVLGAGMDADGTLHASSIGRVKAGVHLYNAGAIDRLHFTGGRGVVGGPAAGAQMAQLAESLGVPTAMMTHEDESLSTLQNALFSVPMLTPQDNAILISEGFHLLRGKLSFRWAGFPIASACHSTRFRVEGGEARFPAPTMILREVAAFWFNLGRAGAWSLLNAIGMERTKIDPLLA